MSRPLAITIIALLVLIAVLLTLILYQLSLQQQIQPMSRFDHERMMRIMMRDYSKPSYRSLGERIYLTGTGEGGRPIPNSMMPRGMMGNMMTMGCANCHRPSGRGGVLFPDGRTKSKNIRWRHLRKEYDDRTLRRAITQGIDEEGDSMSEFMPRWRMTESELQAVIRYLKTR